MSSPQVFTFDGNCVFENAGWKIWRYGGFHKRYSRICLHLGLGLPTLNVWENYGGISPIFVQGKVGGPKGRWYHFNPKGQFEVVLESFLPAASISAMGVSMERIAEIYVFANFEKSRLRHLRKDLKTSRRVLANLRDCNERLGGQGGFGKYIFSRTIKAR